MFVQAMQQPREFVGAALVQVFESDRHCFAGGPTGLSPQLLVIGAWDLAPSSLVYEE
jgi:hypothetical protein